MSSAKTIESLRKENSNLHSTNAKILERIKEMKGEMSKGYEERVGEYKRECFQRMMLRIEEEVEGVLKKKREEVKLRFGELDAGFCKEEEKWKRLEREWKEEKEELVKERDLLKRKRRNVLPSPRDTAVLEGVKEEVGVGLEQQVSQAVEERKRRKVGGEFDPEKGRRKMLPMRVKVGGVLWEDGIGGVLEGLQGTSVVVGEGSRWLMGKEEQDRRRANGSLSSTVLLKVLGEESVRDLCRHGIWMGGRWCSVKRFMAVPSRVKEEEFGRRFGAMEEAVGEMKKGIGKLLRARNEAANRIAYGEALKACDDEEGADTEDDERFIRRMEVIFQVKEALKRWKLWGEVSTALMARARGRRGADMGKVNNLRKQLEKRVNKGKSTSGKAVSKKGKEKAAFVVSDEDDGMLSDSDAMVRRLWLDGGRK
ncbi:hypothetical protein HOY80DRAFT_1080678 [Tuber brumale]|nr:hypothetical protein HOY80DRAFT_1080678 [Tuber brumale]